MSAGRERERERERESRYEEREREQAALLYEPFRDKVLEWAAASGGLLELRRDSEEYAAGEVGGRSPIRVYPSLSSPKRKPPGPS